MANDNTIKTFEVQGSAATPYTVTFTMTGNDLAKAKKRLQGAKKVVAAVMRGK